jgi:hypothetical protein
MLSGCSVGMAVAGKETPNLAACRVGATQADIQAELGRPTSSRVLENGDSVCTYAYEVGNDPSAGRAVLHGGMDVLTFGLWELVGTPAEAMQGQKYEMTVTYDAEARVCGRERTGWNFGVISGRCRRRREGVCLRPGAR